MNDEIESNPSHSIHLLNQQPEKLSVNIFTFNPYSHFIFMDIINPWEEVFPSSCFPYLNPA
jgi:hypothetical protein